MRSPLRLWRELGGRGFIGFQVFRGGVLLSVLVHPWFYVLALAELGFGLNVVAQSNPSDWFGGGGLLWALGLFNLIAGYVLAVAVGAAAVVKRGWRALSLQALLMPAYWLLISLAAYRAIWQLIRAPSYWEKTQHRQRTDSEWRALQHDENRLG